MPRGPSPLALRARAGKCSEGDWMRRGGRWCCTAPKPRQQVPAQLRRAHSRCRAVLEQRNARLLAASPRAPPATAPRLARPAPAASRTAGADAKRVRHGRSGARA
eukprot:scaffold7242_cov400-Prasinococcus_capsulatus_cf.AAC.14